MSDIAVARTARSGDPPHHYGLARYGGGRRGRARSPRRCAPAWTAAAARSARAIGRPSWRRPTWSWTRPGRKEFLRTLASFDSDADAVAGAYAEVQAAADPAELATAKAALRRALEPPRLRLLTQFTTIPDGRKFLVDLRAFLLKMRKRRQAAGGAGGRPARPARGVVRHRLSGVAADRLEQPRHPAGEAGRTTRRCTRSVPGAT